MREATISLDELDVGGKLDFGRCLRDTFQGSLERFEGYAPGKRELPDPEAMEWQFERARQLRKLVGQEGGEYTGDPDALGEAVTDLLHRTSHKLTDATERATLDSPLIEEMSRTVTWCASTLAALRKAGATFKDVPVLLAMREAEAA